MASFRLIPQLESYGGCRMPSSAKRVPFSKKKKLWAIVYRSFQASRFSSWKWFHYSEAEDSVLCILCEKATREKGVVVTGNLGSCDQVLQWKLLI